MNFKRDRRRRERRAEDRANYVDVLVVGAGISGIGIAHHLQCERAGTTFAVLEAREEIGGTWSLFRYPGIRSDSDMPTFGYGFKPWTLPVSIAEGPYILEYLPRTVDECGIRDRIRLGHKVISADFDTGTGLWTVTAGRTGSRRTTTFTSRFLFVSTGYYDYDSAYTPDFKGVEAFKGPVVHPQFWPEDLVYTDRIVFIGAAGEMCRIAIERFARAGGDWELVLCDIRPESLNALVRSLPVGRASVRRLDLFDPAALREAIKGASFVVLGAGPYIRTSGPVVEACIEMGVPYLDFDDDVESTEAALDLHERAQKAGVPILLGCGASPGLTNVMTTDAARDLDTVEQIDVCWVTGDERPHPYGRAVLEHAVHIAAGPCRTWENGRTVMHETFVETEVFPLGNTLGDYRVYESAHPETVTLPRRFPKAQRIRVMGGLHPQPANGILRGIGLAVQRGDMTMDEGIDFLDDIMTDGRGNAKGWRHALAGVWGQVRRGECDAATALGYLASGARRKHYRYSGINYVRLTGTRDGQKVVSVRRVPVSGPGTPWTDMAALTGSCCAAFMMVALGGVGDLAGVLAPEDWVEPADFYAALERTGALPHEIVEAVVTPSSMASRRAV